MRPVELAADVRVELASRARTARVDRLGYVSWFGGVPGRIRRPTRRRALCGRFDLAPLTRTARAPRAARTLR